VRHTRGSFRSATSLEFVAPFVEIVGRTLSVRVFGGLVAVHGVAVVLLGEVFGRSAPLLLNLKEAKQN